MKQIWTPDLSTRSGPRYRAIVDALAEAVASGELAPGTRLPTHRELADRLNVTVGTVTRAYQEAAHRGLVAGEVGRGTYVRSAPPPRLDSWEDAFGDRPRADPMDRVMHAARVEEQRQRRHTRPWRELPPGTFVQLGDTGVPALVLDDRLVPWSAAGYGPAGDRPERGQATVLTPAPTVEVLAHGYRPVLHPTAA